MRVFILFCSVLSWCAAVDLAALIDGPPKLWAQTFQARLVQAWEQQTVAVLEAVAPEGGPVGGDEARLLVRVGCQVRTGEATALHLEESLALAERLWSQYGEHLDPLVPASAFLLAKELDRPWKVKVSWCDRALDAWIAWDDRGVQRGDMLLSAQLDAVMLDAWGCPEAGSEGDHIGSKLAGMLARNLAVAIRAQADPVVMFPVFRVLSIGRPQWGETISAAVEPALQASAYPLWVQDALRGSLHIALAWAARGSDWANSVSEEGWRGFSEHLALADAALVRAINDPGCDHPQVATWGMTVAGAGASSRSMALWFRSGARLCADYSSLYGNFYHFSRPRWGGNWQRMLQLGKDADALAQKLGPDLDTHPLAFRRAQAVRSVVEDLLDTENIVRLPTLIDEQELARCHQLLQEEARRWPDQRATHDEFLAALYWHRGNKAKARAVYADLLTAQGRDVLLNRWGKDKQRLGVPLDQVLPADLFDQQAP